MTPLETASLLRVAYDVIPEVDPFLHEVATSIQERGLLSRAQTVVVGVSGGLDSMVLLEVLSRLARLEENRWNLVVAHFNHKLRGRNSQADERFVRARARLLGWPCKVGQGSVRSNARTQRLSIEMTARRLRHTFLADIARSVWPAKIALAHHADDQIELFWVRLFRGASSEGLAGMRSQATSPVDPEIPLIRPFLDQWRADLEQFAKQEKIPFREDASNQDQSILRNRIRHRLVPSLIREYQPGLRRVLHRQMQLLGAEADYVDEQVRKWAKRRSDPAFAGLPLALQRRSLTLDLIAQGIEPDFALVEHLREHPDVPVMVAPGHAIKRDKEGRVVRVAPPKLEFQHDAVMLDLGVVGRFEWGGARFSWRVQTRAPAQLRGAPGREWFDAERVGRFVELRHWRKGDRFEPSGLGAPAKLQDLFTNLRIPASQRRSRVVATSATHQIWWVQGLRIAEQFKVRPTTQRFLEWRWTSINQGSAGSK